MDTKIKNLVDMIDFKMFEAMVLLNQSYYSNNVISSDISITGNEKYYELWDEYEEKLTLLVISNDENFRENESVVSLNDGYDNYIFAYPCEEQRLEMLCRFYVEQGDFVPPFMKEIKQCVDELGELFDEMIEG